MEIDLEYDEMTIQFEVAVFADSFSHAFGVERFTSYEAQDITAVYDFNGQKIELSSQTMFALFNKLRDKAEQQAEMQSA